ncbi:Glyceraldehyde-3-phosphate dehydrogenase 1 [Sulfitobacter indolifex]|uniref:Glyceraldehyde-3-phosphate dehydrogenase n=1 Tax=Sulfitobacter indolifex HEL-45 TaxID=391624 RepID=A0ABM9X7P1_9RHOB|nr:type I glyceraldehyde-3-phosphate dehydrogenase [Sulfitobacter indolifex]EDQ05528.1 glyceraldehyde-3-phosphate dehydrogenase, type I [Sulfitobacter indolifex HEL-45]UOA19705.1 Glyceraldehyde-3-phosphate dehydrogenase 1 [Sulfitobacter indolifex]
MTTKIAINGFGRIGRCVLRALIENGFDGIEVVAINDLTDAENLLHLLKYDSVHGRLTVDAELKDGILHVAGQSIRMTAERDPAKLPWGDVDVAYECTGFFTARDAAAKHLENGSKRVLISAPGKGVDRTVVYGVNHQELTAGDLIVSNASCTTNCLAPVAKVLDDTFGIETGYMTTIHAYTGDQPTHDSPHRDPYRGRAAALSMVPTSTGAAAAISEVIPHLRGVLEGSAVRVPTANVSLVDLCIMPKKPATAEAVNAAMQEAANGAMKGVLAYEPAPLVSTDFNHDPHSSTLAPDQTRVTEGGMIRVVSWYDNEWGFSNRMNDTARAIAALI